MINKFIQVSNNLYRGSAPSVEDVFKLKNLGIKKIVSLDKESGENIKDICKKLNIKQLIIPLNGTRQSLYKLLQYNLNKLLNSKPTFVHCKYGKDRTGFVVGLFEIMFQHKPLKEVLKNAVSLGFGVGVDPKFINLYVKILKKADQKNKKDVNHLSIVDNLRMDLGDKKDSYFYETFQKSFAPYVGTKERQFPYDIIYNPVNDQSPTRENYNSYKENKSINLHNNEDVVPLVGVYNNDAGIHGGGPTLNYGGFIYD